MQPTYHLKKDRTLIVSAETGTLIEHKPTQKHTQKQEVRTLLAHCLSDLPNYTFDDTALPYRLTHPKNPPLCVSFSHSQNIVALIISPTACGIDVELGDINEKIAERFFHKNEQALLYTLPKEQQAFARNQLWRLKESLVKLECKSLATFIGRDMSELLSFALMHKGSPTPVFYKKDALWLYQNDALTAVFKET
ncbi:MAG: 4'-phosphopantetheinyl transferase superfamily protein [Moraxella sp.]|nr:4'-phosphopantetheinyl transferase superfamily protein [Moraxella sp.]